MGRPVNNNNDGFWTKTKWKRSILEQFQLQIMWKVLIEKTDLWNCNNSLFISCNWAGFTTASQAVDSEPVQTLEACHDDVIWGDWQQKNLWRVSLWTNAGMGSQFLRTDITTDELWFIWRVRARQSTANYWKTMHLQESSHTFWWVILKHTQNHDVITKKYSHILVI